MKDPIEIKKRLADRIVQERERAVELGLKCRQSGDEEGARSHEKTFYDTNKRLLSVLGMGETSVLEDVRRLSQLYSLKATEHKHWENTWDRLLKVCIVLWIFALLKLAIL